MITLHNFSNNVKIPHKQLVIWAKEGKLQLGIEKVYAQKISNTPSLSSPNSYSGGFFRIMSTLGLIGFIYSIYWSFAHEWWGFVVGLFVWMSFGKILDKTNSENIINDGLRDGEFYNKILAINGWSYQVDDSIADHAMTYQEKL